MTEQTYRIAWRWTGDDEMIATGKTAARVVEKVTRLMRQNTDWLTVELITEQAARTP